MAEQRRCYTLSPGGRLDVESGEATLLWTSPPATSIPPDAASTKFSISTIHKVFYIYSKANALERVMVAGLGGLYFVGVIFLGNLLKQITVTPGGLISLAVQLFPMLQCLPFLFYNGWLLLHKTNNGISRRNKAREGRSQELVSPEPSPRKKLFPMFQTCLERSQL